MKLPPKVAVRLSAAILSLSMLLTSVRPGLGVDEPAAQFTHPLFDGRTTAGWTAENGCEATVDEGRLVLSAGDGWLRSDHVYADFVFHVEWKALQASQYDAGIYIRTPAGGQPFPSAGYQVNLLEGSEGNIPNVAGAVSTGLIRPGDWNTFDITVVGETVSLVVNGTEAYRAAGLKHRTGYIGLQCEVPKGGQFQFRNLWITELGYRSLFNGVDLTGWEGAGEPAEKCWQVRSRLLQCTGTAGPWLRSAAEFDDFNLRLEYQVSAEGNSGVYVRVPANGNHHRENDTLPPAGFEVQILDDAAPKYKDLKDYQFSASVYDIAGATRHVSKPAGQWNTLEIDARDRQITVTHNGVVVVEVTAERFPLSKLREIKGYLGLQNHSTQVSFRNLRIGPPLPFPMEGRENPAR